MLIKQTIEEFSKLIRPSFVGLREYLTGAGELQNVVINVGLDYYEMKKIDIEKLNLIDLKEVSASAGISMVDLIQAKDKITASLFNDRKYTVYTQVAPGIKQHNVTGEYYLHGYTWKGQKKVLKPGTYKYKPIAEEVKARLELEKNLLTPAYRIFKLSKLNEIRINKNKLK